MSDLRLGAQVGADTSAFNSALASASRSTQGFQRTLKMAGAALVALGGAQQIGKAISSAKEFETQIVRLNTLVGIAEKQTNAWASEIRELAPAMGRAPDELARAMFTITSGGTRGAEAMNVLEQAAKAAAIGLGDTAEIGRLAGAAMQAFSNQSLTAERAIDVMVATIREGNLEADSLATAMGRVMPVAAAVGATFEDVGAFIATFTRLGVDAGTATTSLRAALQQAIRPMEGARTAMEEAGFSIEQFRDAIREDGLASALIQLVEATEGNIDKIGEFIPNVRALSGVLGTAASQGEEYVKISDRINQSTGITNEGFERFGETSEAAFNKFSQTIENARIAFGEKLLPTITSGVQLLTDNFDVLIDLGTALVVLLGTKLAAAAARAAAGFASQAASTLAAANAARNKALATVAARQADVAAAQAAIAHGVALRGETAAAEGATLAYARLTAATQGLNAAKARLAVTSGALGTALRGLLALVGGTFGAALLALGGGFLLVRSKINQVREAQEEWNESMETLRDDLQSVGRVTSKAIEDLGGRVEEAREKFADLEKELEEVVREKGRTSAEARTLTKELREQGKAVEELEGRHARLADKISEAGRDAARIYQDNLSNAIVRAEAELVKIEAQFERVREEKGRDAGVTRELFGDIHELNNHLEDLKSLLNEVDGEFRGFGQTMAEIGTAIRTMGEEQVRILQEMWGRNLEMAKARLEELRQTAVRSPTTGGLLGGLGIESAKMQVEMEKAAAEVEELEEMMARLAARTRELRTEERERQQQNQRTTPEDDAGVTGPTPEEIREAQRAELERLATQGELLRHRELESDELREMVATMDRLNQLVRAGIPDLGRRLELVSAIAREREAFQAFIEEGVELESVRLPDQARELGIRREITEMVNASSEAAKRMRENHEAARLEAELQAQAAEALAQIYEEAARSIQRAFADGFKSIFRDGLSGFKDFANRVREVFESMVADIAAAMVAEKLGIPELLAEIERTGKLPNSLLGKAVGIGAGVGVGVGAGQSGGPGAGLVAGAGAGAMMAGPWGALAGGVAGLVSGLMSASDKAEEAGRRMRAAVREWKAALDDFSEAAEERGRFDQRRRDIEEGAKDLAAGLIERVRQNLKGQGINADQLLDFLDDASFEQFFEFLKTIPAAFRPIQDEWEALNETLQKNLEIIEEVRQREIQSMRDELRVRALTAMGRDDEAQIARLQMQQAEEIRRLVELENQALISQAHALHQLEIELVKAEQAARAAAEAEEQLHRARQFTLDLAAREAALAGDQMGEIHARLRARAEDELRRAFDLLQKGAITEDEFRRLARVIEREANKEIRELIDAERERAKAAEETQEAITGVSRALNAPRGLRLSLARWQAAILSQPMRTGSGGGGEDVNIPDFREFKLDVDELMDRFAAGTDPLETAMGKLNDTIKKLIETLIEGMKEDQRDQGPRWPGPRPPGAGPPGSPTGPRAGTGIRGGGGGGSPGDHNIHVMMVDRMVRDGVMPISRSLDHMTQTIGTMIQQTQRRQTTPTRTVDPRRDTRNVNVNFGGITVQESSNPRRTLDGIVREAHKHTAAGGVNPFDLLIGQS